MKLVVSNTGPLMHLSQARATAARVLAASLGVEVHGSLGIVLWAAATGHLNRTEAEAVLNGLAASTLWLSARVFKEAQEALDRIFPVSNP